MPHRMAWRGGRGAGDWGGRGRFWRRVTWGAPPPLHPAVAAALESGSTKVKVAVSDVDGILRGKYLHRDKFKSAAESGVSFCDVVLGWDAPDHCYDNTRLTGWQHGSPDALGRIDPDTARQVPWDRQVPFFFLAIFHPPHNPPPPFP